MNTDRIAYFLAVVREGSFSAAAKNMYVSQTAISQQIASLEKEMGCALFHRLSTGAVLTDQGEQFLPYAERLMGIQLELQDAFADAHRVSAIHIGYNGPLEKELIVDAYLSLHPRLPNLVIHPLYLSLTAMSDALYRGQCNMVLTLPGEIDQRNTYQEVLYDVPMIAAVSEASPLAEKSVVSLSDLRAHPLILLAPDQSRSGRGAIHDWAQNLGFPNQSIIYADSADMQILMVSLNLGISFFPARKPSYFKGVKLIPMTEDIGHHRSVLVCRRLTPAIRMIRDCMIEEMKKG